MPWKTCVATCQGISRPDYDTSPRWCHSMEKLSALMALCEENTPVNHDSSYKWPVVWSFDVFFIASLNILFENQTVYWLVKWYASMLIWYHLKYIRYRPVLSTARPENNIVPFTCCSSIQTSEYMWEKKKIQWCITSFYVGFALRDWQSIVVENFIGQHLACFV